MGPKTLTYLSICLCMLFINTYMIITSKDINYKLSTIITTKIMNFIIGYQVYFQLVLSKDYVYFCF